MISIPITSGKEIISFISAAISYILEKNASYLPLVFSSLDKTNISFSLLSLIMPSGLSSCALLWSLHSCPHPFLKYSTQNWTHASKVLLMHVKPRNYFEFYRTVMLIYCLFSFQLCNTIVSCLMMFLSIYSSSWNHTGHYSHLCTLN